MTVRSSGRPLQPSLAVAREAGTANLDYDQAAFLERRPHFADLAEAAAGAALSTSGHDDISFARFVTALTYGRSPVVMR
jgi:hypothetical protein